MVKCGRRWRGGASGSSMGGEEGEGGNLCMNVWVVRAFNSEILLSFFHSSLPSFPASRIIHHCRLVIRIWGAPTDAEHHAFSQDIVRIHLMSSLFCHSVLNVRRRLSALNRDRCWRSTTNNRWARICQVGHRSRAVRGQRDDRSIHGWVYPRRRRRHFCVSFFSVPFFSASPIPPISSQRPHIQFFVYYMLEIEGRYRQPALAEVFQFHFSLSLA